MANPYRYRLFVVTLSLSLLLLGSCSTARLQRIMIKQVPAPSANQTPEYEKASPQVQDFLFLKQLALDSIPEVEALLGFANEHQREAWMASIQTAVSQTKTEADTCFALHRFISRFRSDHTWVSCDFGFSERYGFIPHIEQTMHETRAWIRDVATPLPEKLIGAEILAIEGLTVNQYIDITAAAISVDTELYAAKRTLARLPVSAWSQYHGINAGDSLTLTLRQNDTTSQFTFSQKYHDDIEWRHNTPAVVSLPTDKPFAYEIEEGQSTAYLRVGSMLDRVGLKDGIKTYVRPIFRPLAHALAFISFRDIVNFNDYMNAFFTRIIDNGTQTIIMDLRRNAGGDFRMAKAFLYYLQAARDDPKDVQFVERESALASTLVDETETEVTYKTFYGAIENPESSFYSPHPKRLFTGQLIVLVDSYSHSAAAFFAALIKDNAFGYLVGEPPGGLATGPTTLALLSLPNSRWSASLATTQATRPSGEDTRLIVPDCWLSASLDDLKSDHDRVLAWAKSFAAANTQAERDALERQCAPL